MRRRLLAPALLAVLVLGGVSACSGDASDAGGTAAAPPVGLQRDGAADESGSDAGSGAGADDAAGGAQAAPGGSASALPAAAVAVRLVRTADVAVEVESLPAAAARVRAVATGLGGTVASEVTGLSVPASVTSPDDPDGGEAAFASPGESVLVLRVPEPSLDTALDRVAAVGTEQARSTTTQDVTADLADLDSRVRTATESLARVRALFDRAERISDVVALESELATRQSDLEALEARRASLAGRADLSTLTVTLRTGAVQPAAASGFVGGLRSGWDALAASGATALRVVGALLPWLVLAALVAVPVRWWLRRRRPVVAQPQAPAAAGS